MPVYRRVALFLRENLSEPNFQLIDLHASMSA
jgi:hypothetical protein